MLNTHKTLLYLYFINTMGATSGAKPVYPSGVPVLTLGF